MRVLPTNYNQQSNTNFQHKILLDIGASNPKGTLKITALSDMGKVILRENSPNSYLNNTVKGFNGAKDFVTKLYKVIQRTYDRVLLKNESGEFPLSGKDLLLSGIAIFVPGTTLTAGDKSNIIAFMPNLKDKEGNSLTNINFADYKDDLIKREHRNGNIEINKDEFNFVVTKDLGGTGVAVAQLMARKKMLKEGDYVMGVMTGGGFGSVDIKVKNHIVEFETSESSSYVAGNYDVYSEITDLITEMHNANSFDDVILQLKANNYKKLKDDLQILGKLGRQGVNVKSHIATFCKELDRPDLLKLLQDIGDARIVEMNRLCVSEKDTELLAQLRALKDDFTEIESTTDGKIAFELNKDKFDPELLKNARNTAINAYANAISLISINKINDCVNKVVLLGPFAHGVNQYVKNHSADFDGAKDLPELIKNKIKTNIDEKHIDLPSTRRLMELYNFEIICDKDLNFSDNTAAGDLFLNPKFKFVPNRGSWFSIPLSALK